MTVDPGILNLRTQRLLGSPLSEADVEDWATLFRDARVMATLGGPVGEEVIARTFRESRDHWQAHGFGIWLFRHASDGAFVGRAGLRRIAIDGTEETELLYAVRPEFWGRGHATEMGAALLDLAFGPLAQRDVVAFTLHSNARSRRVMEKLGMRYERDIVYVGLPHVLLRLRAPAPAR